jgi:hypothetical protein
MMMLERERNGRRIGWSRRDRPSRSEHYTIYWACPFPD